MRLALDAMGGDFAPRAMVAGAIDYAQTFADHRIILVGHQDELEQALTAECARRPANIDIEHAADVIGMADKIAALKEKPDDSMNRCARLVKEGDTDAMVLCGNTACSVAAAQLHLRRIRGVKRAGILTPLPTNKGHTWIIDAGANAVGKPEYLAQWAEMATVFLHEYSGIAKPTVGVLSIGSEDSKGDELTAETLSLLRETDVELVGNVEGNDIPKGTVDIVVCDGFTGNVVLKTCEGVASSLGTMIREEANRDLISKIGGLLMKPAFNRVKKRTHWSLVGGCLLLGVDGITVIGHGRSQRVPVFHALKQAATCVSKNVLPRLREYFTKEAAA